jgi:P63C domain
MWIKQHAARRLSVRYCSLSKLGHLRIQIRTRGLTYGHCPLVDEATGDQDFRQRDALAKILEKFVAKELRSWAKTFPAEFYKQIYRLNGWSYTENSGRPGASAANGGCWISKAPRAHERRVDVDEILSALEGIYRSA